MMYMNWKTDRLSTSRRRTRRNVKRRHLSGTVAVTCAFFLLSACSLLPKEEQMLEPPLVEPAQVEYETVEVTQGAIVKRVTGVGNFTSTASKDLHFTQSGGRIEEIHVKNGDEVKKGEVLVSLETGDLAFQIEQAGLDLEKANIRLEQLQDQGADSYAVDMAEIDKKSVQLRLHQLRKQREQARLTSPIDGYVTHLTEKGQGDQIGAYETIVQVVDPSEMQLIYSATSGKKLVDVDLGMSATVTMGDETYDGEVVQTSRDAPVNVPEEMVELFNRSVILDLEELPEGVEMGDHADIEIVTQAKGETLTIPRRGLRSFMGRDYVQIMDGESKEEVDVEVGIISSTKVEILQGLNAGDHVILK